MKVAFATTDCTVVDDQFRRASRLAVYEITPTGHCLDRICAFPPDQPGGSEDRVRAIDGVSIVHVTAIGPSSAARLTARGIDVATAPPGTSIAANLAPLHPLRKDTTCRA